MLEMYLYETRKDVGDVLKGFIFKSLKDKMNNLDPQSHLRDLPSHRAICDQLKKQGYGEFGWSLEVDFHESILIWQVATEICYYSTEEETNAPVEENRIKTKEIGKQISNYMVYLLLVYPFMLPMGIGELMFQDTYAEASKFFDQQGLTGKDESPRKRKINAAKKLLEVRTDVLPAKVKGDKSKSVLFDACRLAGSLRGIIEDEEKRWRMINHVWMEMLAYAASQCRGIYHAQQLRRGGEFLTHVWLMMAHFGITNHFQISQGHARAKLTVK